jgi:membrane-bound lytic murein transglycosylase D
MRNRFLLPSFALVAIFLLPGCASHLAKRHSSAVPESTIQSKSAAFPATNHPDTGITVSDTLTALDDGINDLPLIEDFVSRATIHAADSQYPQALQLLDSAAVLVNGSPELSANDSIRLFYLDRIAAIFSDLMPPEYIDSATDEISMLLFQKQFSDAYDTMASGASDSLLATMMSCQKNTSYNVPIVNNARVNRALQFLIRGKKGPIHKWLARAQFWLPVMKQMFADNGLPTDLAYLPLIESGFNPKAYSRSRASGIWQFISGTGSRYHLRKSFWLDERRDPIKSTTAAISYLKDLYAMFGNWHLVLASYNCGENGVQRALNRQQVTSYWDVKLPKETMGYVPEFVAALIVAKNYECFGFALQPTTTFDYDTVSLSECIDLAKIAKGLDIDREKLQSMNPHILQFCTPPDKSDVTLYLPSGTRDAFIQLAAQIPPEEKVRWLQYVIRRGDNLGSIAKKFRISVDALKSINKMRSNSLRAGRYLLIPLPADKSTRIETVDITPSIDKPVTQKKKAAVTQTPITPISGKAIKYQVKSGETLWGIAQLFNVDITDICTWNNLDEDRSMKAGTVLTVYPGESASDGKALANDKPVAAGFSAYTVKDGDNPYTIARKLNVSLPDLIRWNELDKTQPMIHPGEVLAYKPASNSATAPQAPVTIVKSSSASEHIVKAGETLSGIARTYSVSIDALQKANGLDEKAVLREGKILKIPQRQLESSTPSRPMKNVVVYTVRKGDTIWNIADTFGVSVDQVYSDNGLEKNTPIRPGATLKIVLNQKM